MGVDNLCDEVQQLIPWVLNGTAGVADQRALHRHIVECAECRREFGRAMILQRRLETLGRALGDMPCEEADRAPDAEDAQDAQSQGLSERDVVAIVETVGLPVVVAAGLRLVARVRGLQRPSRVEIPLVECIEL